MIRPPGFRGAAFTTADEGDLRAGSRLPVSRRLGIADGWATVTQLHGGRVLCVERPGPAGEADGLVTGTPGLPLAVFTADCFGVVLEGERTVAVAHAGWRGAAAGIVQRSVRVLEERGDRVLRAAIGPGIQACCFEVGPEVQARFADWTATTSWGTPSVDLQLAITAALGDVEVWVSDACTRCGTGYLSHRRDATPARMAAIGWMP